MNNKHNKLPPISHNSKTPISNYSNFSKTVLSDGSALYPIDYFNSKISTPENLSKYSQFNNIQANKFIKHDKYHNVNYLRKGVFYVKNHKYTEFNIK